MTAAPGDASRVNRLAAALLGLAMLLLIRRYSGINHDSVLYLGQGLMQRWPEIFGKDLFFAFGSQDRYSIFPWLLGKAMSWAEPPSVFLWGTLASLLLFAAASWQCLRALLPLGQRYWAWLGVLCLPSVYGMVSLFSYAEPFFTPRPIAEALCLLSIVQLVRKRWWLAGACLLFAALFHPLQAIAACLIVWPWLLMCDRRWWRVAWLALPIAALAGFGVGPFGDLFRQADSEWLGRLRGNTPQLFLGEWGVADARVLALDLFLLGLATFWFSGVFRRWCLAALAGTSVGFLASLALVDGLHLVLPAGLQLWRVHWLTHWFAMAALAGMLWQLAQAREWPRLVLLVLVVLMAWNTSGWIWLPLAALFAAWPRLFATVQPRLLPLLTALFALGIAVLTISYALDELTWFRLAHYHFDLYAIDRRLLAFPLFALSGPLLCMQAWEQLPASRRTLAGCCALIPLVAIAGLRWDARSPFNRAFESNAANTSIFGVGLPEDAQVFWDSEMTVAPWLVLRRASYYSGTQLAGEVFSRATAIEGRDRADRLMPLMRESRTYQEREPPLAERTG